MLGFYEANKTEQENIMKDKKNIQDKITNFMYRR